MLPVTTVKLTMWFIKLTYKFITCNSGTLFSKYISAVFGFSIPQEIKIYVLLSTTLKAVAVYDLTYRL